MNCTIYKNIFSKEPHYITIEYALNRILKGVSASQVLLIRETLDKEKSSKLKANLPSICFSGKFGADRKDEQLIEHSGFLVLDFDDLDDLRDKQTEIISHNFIYACWVSPSGNGLKALVKIADGSKHREHFRALQDVFPEIDRSGINPSRVCYESYDPDIYINKNSEIFKKVKKNEKISIYESNSDENISFRNILKWLTNRNDAFVTGERNTYIFKLASACCRFGISEESALSLISSEYSVSNDFTMSEMKNAIKSGYRANFNKFGTAQLSKEKLIDKVTRTEIDVKQEFERVEDENYRVEDVVYGEDVKGKALNINENGFEKVVGIGIPELDFHFKVKRGEITLLSGIGNYGKSSFKKWFVLMRIILFGEKVATFSPEDTPAEEYFHDYVEMILGCECTPYNPNNPKSSIYEAAYDFVSKHIFYISAEMLSPTPKYIKEKFLELIIQEKVDFCVIDPFNQMTNDYHGFGGRTDKYLETFLADCARFAQKNDIYFWIIAHPKTMKKLANGNYECPDIYDIADGGMWANKMSNILIYHRPFAQTEPNNPTAIVSFKKIKKKSVGRRGEILIEYIWDRRRFFLNGADLVQSALDKKGIDFYRNKPKQVVHQISWDNDGVVDNPSEIDF